MEDYRLEQTGQEVQDILNGAATQSDLTAEVERAQGSEGTLQDNIDAEELARQTADGHLQDNIDAEETRAKAAEKQNADDIDAIEEKIPNGASAHNKLATEEYVDDSVATNTATFRGTYNLVSDLHLAIDATQQQIATMLGATIDTADNNDYCFVQIPTSAETPTQIARIDRYKFNGTAWAFEYALNNSGFTAAQWAAINSGITSGDVAKLGNLPTATELANALAGKQDTLTFDNAPTENSNNPVKSGGIYTAINNEATTRAEADAQIQAAIEAILALIPSAATALNQLADKAFVNSSISTNTATFRGTYNLVSDLHLAVDATHAQIETVLASVIATADNNDYAFVQIPTSADTPTEIASTERYKFNGTAWAYEYTLNTSGFTAAQWAAINSGITTLLVTKLNNLPTASELETALNGKQDNLTFDNAPTENSDNPVKSGGIYSAIKAITDLIPSAATDQNQLADKLYVLAQILAATPAFKGQFTALADLQAVASPKAGDLGIVRTTDSDGYPVFTFYQYLNSQWNVYFTIEHHNQNKPASTGTSGDYPYNGMGRVVIPKNMVNIAEQGEPENIVNLLTQDAFEDGEGNPLTNTVFVIQYDFMLGEDITVPENCILEFDGGSISGNSTLTLDSTLLCGEIKCYCLVSGNAKNKFLNVGDFTETTNITSVLEYLIAVCKNVYIQTGEWIINNTINIQNECNIFGDGIDKTVIKTTQSVNSILSITNKIIIRDITFRNFNDFPVSTVWNNIIEVQKNTENIIFERVKFENSSCGVYINNGSKNITFDKCIFYHLPIRVSGTIENPTGANGGYGIVLDGINNEGITIENIRVTNCYFKEVVRHCCYVQNVKGLIFQNNIINGIKDTTYVDDIPFKSANDSFMIYNSREIEITNNIIENIFFFLAITNPESDKKTSKNILISNNIFENCVGDLSAPSEAVNGLIIAQGSSSGKLNGLRITNNVFNKIGGIKGTILACENTDCLSFNDNTIIYDSFSRQIYSIYIRNNNNCVKIDGNSFDAGLVDGGSSFIASNEYYTIGSDNVVIVNNVGKKYNSVHYISNVTTLIVEDNLIVTS